MTSLEQIAQVVIKARKAVLVGHTQPDGDSLGSTAALGLGLEQLGLETIWAAPEQVPEHFAFLPGSERFITPETPLDFDLLLVLDCSEAKRLKNLAWLLEQAPVIVNLDHHLAEEGVGQYNYIDPKSGSTGEIVLDLLDCLKVELNQEIAQWLYTAIVTDTGSFRYENTTAETFRKGARLLETGLKPNWINEQLFYQKSLLSMRLLQIMLGRMELSPDGKLAWSHIEQQDLQDLGALSQQAEGLIDYLRQIQGVEVALLFRELPSGEYRINFRSSGPSNVQRVAAQFGGGGHVRASGCTVEGFQVLEKVREAALAEIVRANQEESPA